MEKKGRRILTMCLVLLLLLLILLLLLVVVATWKERDRSFLQYVGAGLDSRVLLSCPRRVDDDVAAVVVWVVVVEGEKEKETL